MKRLLLATKDKVSNDQYVKELYSVFAGILEIDTYCWEIEKDRPFERKIAPPDVLLMGSPYSFPDARPFITKDTKTILLSFTFGKEVKKNLSSLPAGTETVTCYKHYSEAHQAAYVLYELGLQNLNLYINYVGNKNMVGKKMDVALYSGEPIAIPEEVSTTIDLGPMYISLNTLLDVSMAAGVLDDETEKRILTYCNKLSMPKNHTSFFFNNSSMASMSLRAVTDCIDYGMIIVDENQKIINYNDRFLKMFKIDFELSEKNIMDIPQLSHMVEEMINSGDVKDKLVASAPKNQQLLMSKEKINRDNKEFDVFLIMFKDITELHSLETAFQKQAKKQGYVAKHSFDEIIHRSDKMETLLDRCKKIALVDKPTLLVGESGTGKELFAGAIHNASRRSKLPFVALNCAAIPENLLESELFGYEEGAFSGAKKGGKTGLFQAANKGTLFLDEIGELSLEMQAKLLRVLEEKEIMKVGGDEIISIDTRIIAATNRDLRALVQSGSFRLDLYYRLNTLTVSIPPLRERIQDIPALIEAFVADEDSSGSGVAFTDEVMSFFQAYAWPGNIREFRNCIEYMVSIGESPLGADDLPDYLLEEYRLAADKQREVETEAGSEKKRERKNADVPPAEAHTSRASESSHTSEAMLSELCKLRSEDEEAEMVLKILQRRALGRRKLVETLEKLGCPVSEYRLRRILERLNEDGLVSFGTGSAGCHITEKGQEYLSKDYFGV